MTLPPLPLLLGGIVLMGWPTLKLVATLAARPYWRQARVLRNKLVKNYPKDQARIDREFESGKGGSLGYAMPLLIAWGLPVFAIDQVICLFRGSTRNGSVAPVLPVDIANTERSTKASVLRDPLFHKLSEISLVLSALRFPVSSALSIVMAVLSLPWIVIILCAVGIEEGKLRKRFNETIARTLESLARLTTFSLSVLYHHR